MRQSFAVALRLGHRIARTVAFSLLVLTGGIVCAEVRAAEPLRERRVALVIGNADYAGVARLRNPYADADAVAATLTEAGFQSVKILRDLTFEAMRRALLSFAAEADSADWAVIYFAGHGVEINRQNYLIPVDARLRSDRDVAYEAIPLEQVMASIEGARKLRLVVVDACRDNPFAQQMVRSSTGRSIGRGLSRVEPTGGTLVAYAAREGQVALDGDARNSPFVAALIRAIAMPGLEINMVFRKVRDDVLAATGRKQEPYLYGSLPSEPFYFYNPDPRGAEERAWAALETERDPRAFEDFLAKFPDSSQKAHAIARIAELRTEQIVNDLKRKYASDPLPPVSAPPAVAAQVAPMQVEPVQGAPVQKTPETGVPPAVPPPASPAPPALPAGVSVPPSSEKPIGPSLARSIQVELKRLGCLASAPQDGWSRDAQSGVAAFNRVAKLQLQTTSATEGALWSLRQWKQISCAPVCAEGQILTDGVCVTPPRTRPIRSTSATRRPRPDHSQVVTQPAPDVKRCAVTRYIGGAFVCVD